MKLRQILEEALDNTVEYNGDFVEINFPNANYELDIRSPEPTTIRWDHENEAVVLE